MIAVENDLQDVGDNYAKLAQVSHDHQTLLRHGATPFICLCLRRVKLQVTLLWRHVPGQQAVGRLPRARLGLQ